MNSNRFTIFRSLTVLRQLSLHAGLVDQAHDSLASAKIDTLLGKLHEVTGGGHRALVFSQFTASSARYVTGWRLRGVPYC
jgi:SNF2 family DNA or RNA helicase